MNLISIDGPDVSRGEVDNTHMGTSDVMEYLPGQLYDGGTMTMTVEHDGDVTPPIITTDSPVEVETITITWGSESPAANWAFSGFMSGYKPGASIGERMEATVTVKVCGAIAVS